MSNRRRPLATAALVAAALATLPACDSGTKPFAIAAPKSDTRRTVAQGQLEGGDGRYGSEAWLGVPFAAPPVGDLRWRAPRPPAPWTGVRRALTPPPACTQPASFLSEDGGRGPVTGSEDCLYLNVYAPKPAAGGAPTEPVRRPVLFWIHGGANSIGRSAFFEGGHLATAGDVVVVTTQYRLGPMGWFRHRALRAGADDAAEQSGNFGTLDLIAALRWVKENIAAFGGDPDNVTLFGESAGGADVYTLLLAPPAKGLFHRAIVQSGGLFGTDAAAAEAFTDEPGGGHANSANEIVARILVNEGRARDRAAAKQLLATMPDADLAAFLRALPPARLFAAYGKPRGLFLDLPLLFRDGAVLPREDWLGRLATPGGWNAVPVIAGTNRDEMKLFYFLDPRRVRRVLGVFPRVIDEATYEADAEHLSRAWKLVGADLPAQAMRRSGARDVWVYRFDWRGQPVVAGADLSKLLGAAHALEIPFVFGHFDLGRLGNVLFPKQTAPARERLSAAMMAYWTELARRGDPGRGGGELPEWTRFDDSAPDKAKFLRFDLFENGGPVLSGDLETRAGLLAAIAADRRLDQPRKCRLFAALTGSLFHVIEPADYPGQGCADHPLAARPDPY